MKLGSGLDMNRRWFVEIDGRAQGPFTQAQVQDLARLKRITPMTRIFTEGDVRWRLMNEFDEFKMVPESSSSAQPREWVVLKRKTLKEAELSQNKFDQVGPFTIDEITEQLKTGDLSYNDYAWKKGFQRWAKLEALSDFNHTIKPAVPSVPNAPPMGIAFISEPKLDINPQEQNELDQFTATNTQALSLEAESAKPSKKAKLTSVSKKSARVLEEQIDLQTKASEAKDQSSDEAKSEAGDDLSDDTLVLHPGLSRGRKIVRFALATIAACVVTAVAYQYVTEDSGSLESNEPAAAAEVAAAPAPTEPELPVTATDNLPVAEMNLPVPPSTSQSPTKTLPPKQNARPAVYSKADFEMPKNPRIDFEVLKPDSIGQIVISTNAPVNHPVELKITGKSGQILRYTSYSQFLKVQRQGGEVPSIQLSALRLPFGTYTVQAKFAEQVKQKTFFYGVRDAKFQTSLDAHLKKISTEQILEKKVVFYFLRDLETHAKKLEVQRAKAAKAPGGWAKAYSSWRKEVQKAAGKSFAALKGTTGRDLAYPEIIAKAKELSQALLKQGEELNGAIVQNRSLASSGMGPILSQIRDFKKEVAVLSRY